MDSFNKNREISRIENIEEKNLGFYQGLGYGCSLKSRDYLCLRSDLAGLCGDKFKSKRASCNHFIKHYDFKNSSFSLKTRDDCFKLYNYWMSQRRQQCNDPVYQFMLKDSRTTLKNALRHYSDLGFSGIVVRVQGQVKGFSFGFRLNKDTFCILYEITDLSVKGLAQYIFRRFCGDLVGYKYINIMDDSGLKNLKKVKLSYHPAKLIAAYTAKRKNA